MRALLAVTPKYSLSKRIQHAQLISESEPVMCFKRGESGLIKPEKGLAKNIHLKKIC